MKEKQTLVSPFFSVTFVMTKSLKRRKIPIYISLFTVAISKNRTREFLKIIPANYENFLKLVRITSYI